jgi:CubicO group peptidase (beta-lactamase class C family)
LVVHEGDNPLADLAKSPGAVVLVDTPAGRILKADGFASVEDQTPMQTSDRLEIGSNSKMFLGVLLAQLQEEGVLTLDDQLSQWLPEIAAQLPNGDDMTLRQLATHTAGVWDYGNSIIGGGVINPDLLIKDYTPQDIVDFTIKYGQPDFAPGEEGRWKYSNTGFILLGMAIEAATGQAYGDLLQERIFDPLQMNDSSFLEGVPEPGSIVNGYFNFPFVINTTNWNGSQGWAAGSIVSTAEDMAKFATALMHGDLFQDPQTLEVMTDFIEVSEDAEVANISGIGYGTGLIEFAPGFWGHRGQTAGFTSIIAVDPEEEFVFIALTNSAEGAVGLVQDPIGHFLGIEIVGEE